MEIMLRRRLKFIKTRTRFLGQMLISHQKQILSVQKHFMESMQTDQFSYISSKTPCDQCIFLAVLIIFVAHEFPTSF